MQIQENIENKKDKAVLVYDGECRFCIARVANIRRMDARNQFDYLPRLEAVSAGAYPAIESIDLEEGMLLITPDHHVYVGADAVYQIARRLPTAKYIAWLYQVPGCHQIAQLIYKWIAANRKKLGKTCEDDKCKI